MRRSTTRLRVLAVAVLAGMLAAPQSVLAVPLTGSAEIATYSTARLRSIHNVLDARIADVDPIPNTSWGVDPRTNRVAVEIFDGVSAADEKRLMDVVAGYGDAVTVRRLPGEIRTAATYATHGGIGIHSRNNVDRQCTLGFNVRNSAGKKYFLTAGHCVSTDANLLWDRNEGNIQLGERVWHDFGGLDKDFAIMEYQNGEVAAYGAVTAFGVVYDIDHSRYPDAGDPVHRSGRTSSDLVGEVISPSETVTVSDAVAGAVVLKNMIKTNLCVRAGDSGGPLWSDAGAIGITSAGNGLPHVDCRSQTNNERSWYQPVHWVLVHYGLEAF